jgi:hypothetical protein
MFPSCAFVSFVVKIVKLIHEGIRRVDYLRALSENT